MALSARQRSGASCSASGALAPRQRGRGARPRLCACQARPSFLPCQPLLRSGGGLDAASGQACRGALWTPDAACASVALMDHAKGPDSPRSDGVESGQPHKSLVERGAPRGALWV
jgi:hypothetical protein